MTRERGASFVPFFILALALAVFAGCGKGAREFSLREIGFSMKLPAGWEQGVRGNGRYEIDSGGNFFFENPHNPFPLGKVAATPLEGASFKEFVEKELQELEKSNAAQQDLTRLLNSATGGVASEEIKEGQKTSETAVISKNFRSLAGNEAVEITVGSARLTTLHVGIHHGDKVIIATFQAPKEEFAKYEPLFRKAIETVKIR